MRTPVSAQVQAPVPAQVQAPVPAQVRAPVRAPAPPKASLMHPMTTTVVPTVLKVNQSLHPTPEAPAKPPLQMTWQTPTAMTLVSAVFKDGRTPWSSDGWNSGRCVYVPNMSLWHYHSSPFAPFLTGLAPAQGSTSSQAR